MDPLESLIIASQAKFLRSFYLTHDCLTIATAQVDPGRACAGLLGGWSFSDGVALFADVLSDETHVY